MNKARGIIGSLPRGARIAVIRLRSLGDSILATPAIHLLGVARLDVEIAVVTDSQFRGVYEGNSDVAAILEPTVRAVRSFGSDLCINLHGGNTSARLTLLSGAKFRAGFAHFRYSKIYNISIPRAQEVLGVTRRVHTAEHAASAVFHLGVEETEIPRARLFTSTAPPHIVRDRRPYAVIHPTASHPDKTWPAPFFASIAQYLNREMGLTPVFVAGPGEDISPFQTWPVVAGASLDTLKALIQDAALFLGNDSGPAHMAAAFGRPVVVLFGSSDPVVWSPWRTQGEVLVSEGPIQSISETAVMRALDRMRVYA